MASTIAFSLPITVTFVVSGGSAYRLEGNLTYKSNNTLIIESKERRAKIERLLLTDLRDFRVEGNEQKGTFSVISPSTVVTPQGTANNGKNSFKFNYDFGSNKPDARNMKSLIEALQREHSTSTLPDASKATSSSENPTQTASKRTAGSLFTASSSVQDLLKQLNINDYRAIFKSPVTKSIESAIDPAASPLNRVFMELSFLRPVTLNESSVSARYCKGFRDLTSPLDSPQLSMIFCPDKVTFQSNVAACARSKGAAKKPCENLNELVNVHSFANAVKTNLAPVRVHVDVDDRTSFWQPAQRDLFGDLGPARPSPPKERPAACPSVGETEGPGVYPSMVQSFYQGGAELVSYFQK